MLRRNVLLFHNAALGDFVMTWPIAVAVGRVLAQSRVMYVTAASKGRLAERLIGVESVDAEAGWHALHADAPGFAGTPEKLLKSMQMAIVFSRERDQRVHDNIRALAGDAPVVHLAPNPPAGVHVWTHHLTQLESAPVLHNAVQQVQRLAESQGLGRASASKGKQIVIHPGSGAARKNWPAERFVAVARILRQADFDPIFTLGEVELDTMPASVIATFRTAGEVIECRSLDPLADAIVQSAAFLGNDSGPAHLSALLGKPTVAMFGPTSDPACWAPRGPRVTVHDFAAEPERVAETLINQSTSRR
jgi:heptosyltransferase III